MVVEQRLKGYFLTREVCPLLGKFKKFAHMEYSETCWTTRPGGRENKIKEFELFKRHIKSDHIAAFAVKGVVCRSVSPVGWRL